MTEVTKTVDPAIAAKDTNGDGHISLEEYEMDMEFKRKELENIKDTLDLVALSYDMKKILA